MEQVKEIHKILEGREVVALGGHTHSIENLREGDSRAGWSELFGIDALPFTHITAGAPATGTPDARLPKGTRSRTSATAACRVC